MSVLSYNLTNVETAWLIVMFAFGLKFSSVLFKIFNVFKLYTEDTAHDDISLLSAYDISTLASGSSMSK